MQFFEQRWYTVLRKPLDHVVLFRLCICGLDDVYGENGEIARTIMSS